MGVYHLMGLGRSPGAITGPLSYLGQRYQRWDLKDQDFFARSGEVAQREVGKKVGDIQAVILFTTSELLTGQMFSYTYVNNPAGRATTGPERAGEPMKDILKQLLSKIWATIAGGRAAGSLFWCEIDRRDLRSTFERVTQVVMALASSGSQGHEIWMNLTGGNNVVNLSLELAANLSGRVARLYYVQAANPAAEKCVQYTAEKGYWVDLPVMPLALGRVSQAILDVVINFGPITSQEIHSRLLNHPDYGLLVYNLSTPEQLFEAYLRSMWTQGLLQSGAQKDGPYTIGPQWELVRPYQLALEEVRLRRLTIEQLSAQEPWIEHEELPLERK